jgi:SAM-dependent methyltransferase
VPSRAALIRRHARRRGWLRLPPRSAPDGAVKPEHYLPVYERLAAPLRFRRCAILELGIWRGDSLVMWRDALPRATVVGIDLDPPRRDLGPRVHMLTGDQSDPTVLSAAGRLAPGGFDLIIDDAAHQGVLAARSLQALFAARLKPGGCYVIEDWGTGYMTGWPDGARPDPVRADTLDAHEPVHDAVRVPSHDAGMVGLLKRLVDHIGARRTLERHGYAEAADHDPLPIESIEIRNGLAVLRKRG